MLRHITTFNIIRYLISRLLLLLLTGLTLPCQGVNHIENNKDFDKLAIEYLKLGLAIQEGYPNISFYYRGGPDFTSFTSVPGILPKPKIRSIPQDSLITMIELLKMKLDKYISSPKSNDTLIMRAKWIMDQLSAFKMQIRLAQGEKFSFDDEAILSFNVHAPAYDEEHYRSIVAKLDKILPGEGTVRERYLKLSSKFIIPKERVDTIIKTIFAESRRRTNEEIELRQGESFKLKYVTGEVWQGTSTYLGNYSSLIKINLDLPIDLYRAVDIVCHEGYPGHHLYSIMMDKNLQTRGWLELSLRLTSSPQSFISEGIANYGIEMVFPGDEFNTYVKEVLIPLANLDTIGADLYFKARKIKNQMKYLNNEIARGVINMTMSTNEILKWQYDYDLLTVDKAAQNLKFIKENRSYVISYNYGEDLVKNYVETKTGQSGIETTRWKVFEHLISNSNLVIASGLEKY